jgi:hypothetical protein
MSIPMFSALETNFIMNKASTINAHVGLQADDFCNFG